MGSRYRVFSSDGNPIGDADSIDGVVETARERRPGQLPDRSHFR